MATQYIVFCGSKEPYIRERNSDELDRASTIRQLAEGQFDVPSKIVEYDLESGKCRDVTTELAAEVAGQWAEDGEPLSDWRREFVELSLGVAVANEFSRSMSFNHARGF
jgi:hypothetical protein